jgi:hypothetical protein
MENFAFNLVVKLSVELGYVFLSLRLSIAPMFSALLSVLLDCNRRILRHQREIQQHVTSNFDGSASKEL